VPKLVNQAFNRQMAETITGRTSPDKTNQTNRQPTDATNGLNGASSKIQQYQQFAPQFQQNPSQQQQSDTHKEK
jgi:hypothetical protein